MIFLLVLFEFPGSPRLPRPLPVHPPPRERLYRAPFQGELGSRITELRNYGLAEDSPLVDRIHSLSLAPLVQSVRNWRSGLVQSARRPEHPFLWLLKTRPVLGYVESFHRPRCRPWCRYSRKAGPVRFWLAGRPSVFFQHVFPDLPLPREPLELAYTLP